MIGESHFPRTDNATFKYKNLILARIDKCDSEKKTVDVTFLDRANTERKSVPVSSPFVWRDCGFRYEPIRGTHVLLAHRVAGVHEIVGYVPFSYSNLKELKEGESEWVSKTHAEIFMNDDGQIIMQSNNTKKWLEIDAIRNGPGGFGFDSKLNKTTDWKPKIFDYPKDQKPEAKIILGSEKMGDLYFQIETTNDVGDEQKYLFTIDKHGNVTRVAQGTLTDTIEKTATFFYNTGTQINVTGNQDEVVSGNTTETYGQWSLTVANMTITSPGDGTLNITAPSDVNITGNLNVTGTITATGNIESTGGDVIASGISLLLHTHTYVAPQHPAAPTETSVAN